jgi:hypothetical protein
MKHTEARLVKSTGYEKYPKEPTAKRPDADTKTSQMGNSAWNMSPGFCTRFFPFACLAEAARQLGRWWRLILENFWEAIEALVWKIFHRLKRRHCHSYLSACLGVGVGGQS